MQSNNDSLYQRLLLSDTPLIDTRAPAEFNKGGFPHAVSLPLMTDEERAKVGTCYKQQGQQAAIALGHQLVNGRVKAKRVEDWLAHIQRHPDAWLYCWRGGLRSQIVQQWLHDEGVNIERVPGGYKALRQFILRYLDTTACALSYVVVSGYTGSGKTLLINDCENSIDLEGRANHKGSAFGADITAQPTQINFENSLAIDLMKLDPAKRVMVEDEGSFIGSCNMPLALYDNLQSAPCVMLNEPLEVRVDNLIKTYVVALFDSCKTHRPDNAEQQFEHLLKHSLYRIRKRLGDEAYRHIQSVQEEAIRITLSTGDVSAHGEWIRTLLTRYYDPMYRYQLDQSQREILFEGNRKEIQHWWRHVCN